MKRRRHRSAALDAQIPFFQVRRRSEKQERKVLSSTPDFSAKE
jgi:hypothetical protein